MRCVENRDDALAGARSLTVDGMLITAQLDVLLSGSIDSPPRPDWEVWQEIGLFKQEQPALLAGAVQVRRERVTSLLDAPYAGFPAATVMGIEGDVQRVVSIENLTTFHSMAKQHSDDRVLIMYTAGMPSPAWRGMYRRILNSTPSDVSVEHWGDVDEGGFRIAATLATDVVSAGRRLSPLNMTPSLVPSASRRPANDATVARMALFASRAGWDEIAHEIGLPENRFTVEQESL